MALMKWEPFKMLEEFPLFSFNTPFFTKDFAVDVYEEKGNVIAEMNLPGIKPEEITVTFQDGHLKIAAKREEEKETKEKEFFYKEIKRGTYERLIPLPAEVKAEKTEAHYHDGVLKVVMPVKEEIKKESIKVKVQ